jgi:uncharacterized integral membrane protein
MKLLSRFLLLLFVLVGVLIAVSNPQRVTLELWPLPQGIELPLYLLVVALLLLGVLAGLIIGWWAGRHHRRRGREFRAEADRLDRELARARQALAAQPAPLAGEVTIRNKALDRQTALVSPDPLAIRRDRLS